MVPRDASASTFPPYSCPCPYTLPWCAPSPALVLPVVPHLCPSFPLLLISSFFLFPSHLCFSWCPSLSFMSFFLSVSSFSSLHVLCLPSPPLSLLRPLKPSMPSPHPFQSLFLSFLTKIPLSACPNGRKVIAKLLSTRESLSALTPCQVEIILESHVKAGNPCHIRHDLPHQSQPRILIV